MLICLTSSEVTYLGILTLRIQHGLIWLPNGTWWSWRWCPWRGPRFTQVYQPTVPVTQSEVKPPLIAGHCKPISPNMSGWATGHQRWCWNSMSCEKVSLCYACGDRASSYCHIKCKNFPALLQGIVAHITKYVQGTKKIFDNDNNDVHPCLYGQQWPLKWNGEEDDDHCTHIHVGHVGCDLDAFALSWCRRAFPLAYIFKIIPRILLQTNHPSHHHLSSVKKAISPFCLILWAHWLVLAGTAILFIAKVEFPTITPADQGVLGPCPFSYSRSIDRIRWAMGYGEWEDGDYGRWGWIRVL